MARTTLPREVLKSPAREAPAALSSRSSARLGNDDARRSRVEIAYRAVKQRILTNEYPPAFQATETELAARLGMSRTPVREALLRLQSDGLVELTPRHGIRVLPIYPDDLREIYELLVCLESTAAELLANRALPADAPEFREMEAANAGLHEALERNDLETYAAMDDRFHRLLVGYCGNQRLVRVVASVTEQQHRARMLTLRLRPRPDHSFGEHGGILDAIRRGDARLAHEMHRAHRIRGMKLILGLIEKYRLGHL